VQNACGIGKGHQTNSGFSAQRTTRRFVRNALRLKLHGARAALEDRAGCFDSSFSAIVAQDSIVSDPHHSRRQDMQAEAADEPDAIDERIRSAENQPTAEAAEGNKRCKQKKPKSDFHNSSFDPLPWSELRPIKSHFFGCL
jgi:hypothetical protein